jgi:Kef-type K+ transport system membrane component KefB
MPARSHGDLVGIAALSSAVVLDLGITAVLFVIDALKALTGHETPHAWYPIWYLTLVYLFVLPFLQLPVVASHARNAKRGTMSILRQALRPLCAYSIMIALLCVAMLVGDGTLQLPTILALLVLAALFSLFTVVMYNWHERRWHRRHPA